MSSDFHHVLSLNAEQRYNFMLKQVTETNKIWILTDEHGCVMLNTEDEDCVPVWPGEEFANEWATGEWSGCSAMAIELSEWKARWTDGLTGDEVEVVAFPSSEEEGFILSPQEFEQDLSRKDR